MSAREQEQITPEMLEEFDRLGEVVDTHNILCQCERYCVPFMALGDEIRAHRTKEKASATK